MIYAKLDDLKSLETAPEAVRRAARLLADALSAEASSGRPLPDGKTTLGDFTLIVSDPETAGASERPFESHRRFVDLQVVLVGAEGHEAAALRDCRPDKPYDGEGDCELHASSAARSHYLLLREGDAVVYFPEDAHKPLIDPRVPGPRLRKAVVKIPAEGLEAR